MNPGKFLCVALLLAALPAGQLWAQAITTTPHFTPNQELPLPLTAGNLPVMFIVRGAEPSNRTDTQGTIYVSTIRGVPGGVDAHRWSPVVDPPQNSDGTFPFVYLGQPDGCGIFANGCDNIGVAQGGGDVDIATNLPDPITTVPNLALSSLTLAPGITGTNSTDRGNTFAQPNPVVALIPGDDRQWMDAGVDSSTVYIAYHDAATFNIDVQRSTDGGFTYVSGAGEAIDAATFPAAGNVGPNATANIAGKLVLDKSASCSSRGNLYSIFVAPDNATENANGQPMRSVYVAVSTDAKLGGPTFTFTDYKVFSGPMGAAMDNIFPALDVDNFGNLYATWSDNTNIYFSSSTNQGQTWLPAKIVSTGPTAGMANVFPWIGADGNGHVVITWFGNNRPGNSNDTTIMEPCPTGSTTCMQNWAQWKVIMAESTNASGARPVFKLATASDHVVHRGTISTGGLTGSANRNLGDYFQVSLDPQHHANIAFADDHKVSPLTASNHTGFYDPQATRLIRANFTHANTIPSVKTTGVCAP